MPLPALPEDDQGGLTDHDFDGFHDEAEAEASVSGVLRMQMVGDGPLVVREKFHASHPMTIDDALLEMELVGHDFFAYHDSQCGKFSVIYRRRGYDYGVIRLVENEHGVSRGRPRKKYRDRPGWYCRDGTRSFSDMSYPVRELRTLRKERP